MKVKRLKPPKYHQSVYKVKNRQKYRGNADNIIARSSWERQLMIWLDENDAVVEFSSEEVVIPYKYTVDGKWHRYFVDFYIKFKDGRQYLVEVKPAQYTRPPKKPKRETKRFREQVMEWEKNNNKWHAAMKYAQKNGMIFEVWDENMLKNIGVRLLK